VGFELDFVEVPVLVNAFRRTGFGRFPHAATRRRMREPAESF
jgi:hypothetical protein